MLRTLPSEFKAALAGMDSQMLRWSADSGLEGAIKDFPSGMEVPSARKNILATILPRHTTTECSAVCSAMAADEPGRGALASDLRSQEQGWLRRRKPRLTPLARTQAGIRSPRG